MNALSEQTQGGDTVHLCAVYKHDATLSSRLSLPSDGRKGPGAKVQAVWLV